MYKPNFPCVYHKNKSIIKYQFVLWSISNFLLSCVIPKILLVQFSKLVFAIKKQFEVSNKLMWLILYSHRNDECIGFRMIWFFYCVSRNMFN